MPASADLPDVNVWLALSAEDHPHHGASRRYWESESASQVAFCRVTMLGLLRLATNTRVMDGRPFDAMGAWSLYRQYLAEPGVEFVGEPAEMDARFALLTELVDFPNSRWTDAYLAAFALSGGYRIVSFDSAFLHYPALDLQLLNP